MQAAPGIPDAALVNTLPLTGVARRSLELEGLPAETPLFWLHTITPDYFRVLDIRLESGRAFTRADLSGDAAVAIVPSATARRFWPGESPLGKHVRFAGESRWRSIVGVTADGRRARLRPDAQHPELDGRRYSGPWPSPDGWRANCTA